MCVCPSPSGALSVKLCAALQDESARMLARMRYVRILRESHLRAPLIIAGHVEVQMQRMKWCCMLVEESAVRAPHGRFT
jgi:hypothetical protein